MLGATEQDRRQWGEKFALNDDIERDTEECYYSNKHSIVHPYIKSIVNPFICFPVTQPSQVSSELQILRFFLPNDRTKTKGY